MSYDWDMMVYTLVEYNQYLKHYHESCGFRSRYKYCINYNITMITRYKVNITGMTG